MAFHTMYSIGFYDLCLVASLRSLAKETMIYGLSYSLGRLINFLLVTVYLTRIFSEERAYFSIYSEIYFLIAVFLGLLTLRMETTFFRFVSDTQYKSQIYPLASQLVFIAVIVFVAFIYIGIDSIESFLQYPELRPLIYLSAWIVVTDVLSSLPFAKLRFQKRAMRYAAIKMTGLAINIILVLLFLNMFDGDAGTKLEYVLWANLAGSAAVLILLLPEIRESFVQAEWGKVRKILHYSYPLMLVTLSFIFIQYGSTSMLKYFLPGSILENLEQSSQFNAAARLAVIMNLFVTAFNYAAEPFFFRHAGQQESRKVFARVSLFFTIACCFIYLGTCLFIDVIAVLLDKQFRGELFLVNILLMANIFAGLYANFSSWYKLSDRNLSMAWISISGMFIMILLNLLMVPHFGNASAAYANLCSYFFICFISYYQGQKQYPIPYPIFKMAAYLGASVLLVWCLPAAYRYWDLDFWPRQLISAAAVIGFGAWIYFMEFRKLRNQTNTD